MNNEASGVPRPIYGSFGIFRWFLATLVLLGHLCPVGSNDFNYAAAAVKTFFILSGYTASHILDNRYLDMKGGILKYGINRALRIYPLYWAVIIASVWLVSRFPDTARHFNGYMVLPSDGLHWFFNITIFGLASQISMPADHALMPVAWSLAIEMEWWCFMPLFVRNPVRRKKFFQAGFFYLVLICVTQSRLLDAGYFSVISGSTYFALGLSLYLHAKNERKDSPVILSRQCMVILMQPLFYAVLATNLFGQAAILIIPIVGAASIYYLSGIDNLKLSPFLRKVDYILGHLAYPVFLLNYFCGVLVNGFYPSLVYKSWGLALTSLLLANILGLFLFLVIELPVERVRKRFKC